MKTLKFKGLLLWVFALALSAYAPQASALIAAGEDSFPTFILTDLEPARIEIGSHMGFIIDASKTLTIDQVRSQSNATWNPIRRTSPSFGFSDEVYWFRFEINNKSKKTLTRLIELSSPLLDKVDLYHQDDGRIVQSYALGDEQVFSTRALRHPNFVMPVQLSPGLSQIYLRIASSGAVEAPMIIWEPTAFQEATADEHLLSGALMGMLMVMIVYNFFVFLSTRDLSYAYYIAFAASYLFFWATLNGYAFAYLWPNAVRWNSIAISTFVAAACLSACLFANKFLNLQVFSKIAHMGMLVLTGISGALLLSTFIAPYSITLKASLILIMVVTVFSLSTGVWRWYQGGPFARLYCLAWSCALGSICVLAACKFGLLPSNLWINHASGVGILTLVLLLSFALADRINNDRTLRINAQSVALAYAKRARASQHALIKATERANQELERRVASRTNELNITLGQLQTANGELQRLSTTDRLTQIGNRAYFDNALYTERKRCNRLDQPLSLILFDIDHFKNINDTYGHPAGDVCLRHLAALMRQKVQRTGDVVARYGGEEFVILLLNSTLDYAMSFADEFRVVLEGTSVEVDGQTIEFTASFGVATAEPDDEYTAEHLLVDADRALYQAKRDGRNCVRAAPPPSPSNFALLG